MATLDRTQRHVGRRGGGGGIMELRAVYSLTPHDFGGNTFFLPHMPVFGGLRFAVAAKTVNTLNMHPAKCRSAAMNE